MPPFATSLPPEGKRLCFLPQLLPRAGWMRTQMAQRCPGGALGVVRRRLPRVLWCPPRWRPSRHARFPQLRRLLLRCWKGIPLIASMRRTTRKRLLPPLLHQVLSRPLLARPPAALPAHLLQGAPGTGRHSEVAVRRVQPVHQGHIQHPGPERKSASAELCRHSAL